MIICESDLLGNIHESYCQRNCDSSIQWKIPFDFFTFVPGMSIISKECDFFGATPI